MRRGRLLIVFAIILLAVVTIFFVFRGNILGGESLTEEPAPVYTANIIVASQDIARGALIPADGVMLSPFPAEYVVETMLMDINQAVGYRARMDIGRGVPITTNMVASEPGDLANVGSDAAIAIKPGFTAISIPISRLSSVAFALCPGDDVDVLISMLIAEIDTEFQTILPNLATSYISPEGVLSAVPSQNFTASADEIKIADEEPLPIGRIETDENGELRYVLPSEPQRPRLLTQRLVKKATVLQLGTFPLEEEEVNVPLPTGEGEGQEPVEPVKKTPDIITLIVTPQDALALNWAVKAGVDIMLTLRSPGDFTEDETSPVTLQYLIDNYNIAVPSKLPYGLEPRLDKIVPPILPNDNRIPQQ